jgi:tRNA pseudouridine38-40 synthase
MPRYKLTLAYDGTDFSGWQKQLPHQDSVPARLVMREDDETQRREGREEETQESQAHHGDAQGTSPHAHTSHDSSSTESSSRPSRLRDQSADDQRPRVELRTVQSVLERAVQHVVRQPVVIHGASRTDSGVHAKGQVAAFTCSDDGGRTGGWPAERGTRALVRAINSRLPSDVLITAADIVAPDFNPIIGATSKAYSYRIWTSEDRPLWNRRTVLHLWRDLDHLSMDNAARAFEGEHDFAAFAAAGHGRQSTVRTVFSCRVRRESPHELVIDITGSGFLWNMVRIISGTLVQVGLNRMSRQSVLDALASADRSKAGPTLPPTGLCLEWIKYASGADGRI